MLDDELEKINSDIFKKIGEKIAIQRKKKRRKIKGISKKLNVNVEFLDLIEKGYFLKIPKHVPRLGFVKSYARYLEVDISGEMSEISRRDSNSLKNKSKKSIAYNGLKKIVFLLLFLILLLIIIFLFN